MKTTAGILAGALILLTFTLAIHFNQGSIETKRKLDNERYVRLSAEENLEKASAQIRALEDDLARLTSKMNSTEKLLEQARDVNSQLQERINKATAAQESLQQKLQTLQQAAPNQSNLRSKLLPEAGAT